MLSILILIVFVSLVVTFRSFLWINIIEPIALLCWAVWRIISSVNQQIYWMILIVICTILVFRLFLSGKTYFPQSAYYETYKPPNRVEYWQTLLKDATLGKKENEDLHDNLKQLLIGILAEDERSDSLDFDEIVAEGQVTLPLALHRLLGPRKEKRKLFSIIHQQNLIPITPRWLRRWVMKFFPRDNTLIDETLKWMEAELEISYEK